MDVNENLSIEKVNEWFAQQEKYWKEKEDKWETRFIATELKIDEYGKIIEVLKTENAELRAENAELRAENAELRAENAELRAENAELKVRISALESEIAELKIEVKQQAERIKVLEFDNNDLLADHNRMRKLRGTTFENNRELQKEVVELKTKISELDNKVTKLQKSFDSLRLDEKINNFVMQELKLRKEVQVLAQQKAENEIALIDLTMGFMQVKEELGDSQEELIVLNNVN